jgi:hypothetical protein
LELSAWQLALILRHHLAHKLYKDQSCFEKLTEQVFQIMINYPRKNLEVMTLVSDFKFAKDILHHCAEKKAMITLENFSMHANKTSH